MLAQGRAVVNLDYVLPTWSHPLLTSYQGDLTDEASTRERAAEMAAQHNVTALVNNAVAPPAPAPSTPPPRSSWTTWWACTCVRRCCWYRPSCPRCARGQGRIVNMSSRAALGKGERTAYSATKAGMIGMTRTLAMELGATASPSTPSAPAPSPPSCSPEQPRGAPQTERILKSIAVGRMGTPEDVARAAFSSRPTTASSPARCCTSCGGTTLGLAPV